MEITIFGLRSIILENEKIRVVFVLDKGTEIIEFNYKATDTDIIWRSPLGLSCMHKIKYARKDEQILTDGYTGGWFEAFPNVGGECSNKGACIPQYGEVCYLPWEYTVLVDEPTEVSLRCFVRTTKTPYFMEKIFTVRSGIPSLFINESVVNLGKEALEYQWGHHPNFGSNIIDENCVIDIPAKEIKVGHSSLGSRFQSGTEGIWPYLEDKHGKRVDLRIVMPEGSGVEEVIEADYLSEGRTCVQNLRRGLGIELKWDLNMFPHNVIWQVCNGDSGYPRYGNTYVLGFVIRNDSKWGLENSINVKSCPVIGAGEKKKTWFTITVKKM